MHLALAAADYFNRADPIDRFQRFLEHAPANLGQLLHRLVAGDGEGQDRQRIHVPFADQRRLGAVRKLIEHGGNLVANVLHPGIYVAIQFELDHDPRHAFLGDRPQFIDAGNGVDGFFEWLGDTGLGFFRGSAGQ